MNSIKLTSANLPSEINCPTSKSYAARALIIGALALKDIQLTNMPSAQDTLDLIKILKAIGIRVDSNFNVSGSFPACENAETQTDLELGEGGTTIRFLLPLLALGEKGYNLRFSGRMLERPMQELYDALRALGVRVSETFSGVKVQGPIELNSNVTLDCTRSSQFASSLALVKEFRQIEIEYKNLELSKTYFEMTEFVLAHMRNNISFEIPADFSCAGYFLAYSLFTSDIKINNIKSRDRFQADSMLISILEKIGAEIATCENNALTLKKSSKSLLGIDISGSQCIDLVPTLCFIAAHIPKKSYIRNIGALAHKESDRLSETLKILDFFGVAHQYDSVSDVLEIFGKSPQSYRKQDLSYTPADDHRMVMVASLFLKLRGGGEIFNSEAVGKSFPQFFSFFK